MSKRSQRTQSSQSQKRRGSVRPSTTQEEDDGPIAQKARVSACVRYVLLRAASGVLVRRVDLKKSLFSDVPTAMFNSAFDEATKVLKEVYGYKLNVCDETHGLTYTITNNLPFLNMGEDEDNNNYTKILTMLILTQILMLKNSCNEGSLFNFLKALKIDPEVRHPLFGSVSAHLAVLVKQKMITREVNPTSKQTVYMWGSKAEASISKRNMYNFVQQFYGKPLNWNALLKDADEQETHMET